MWELESSRAKLGSPELSSGESGIALVSYLQYYFTLFNISSFTSLSLYFKYLLSVLTLSNCLVHYYTCVVVLCLSLVSVVVLVILVWTTPCVRSITERGLG